MVYIIIVLNECTDNLVTGVAVDYKKLKNVIVNVIVK